MPDIKIDHYPNLQTFENDRVFTSKNKKFFQVLKNPVRFLYEDKYGTTLRPSDELYYISICARETIRLIGLHWGKKIFGRKKSSQGVFKTNE